MASQSGDGDKDRRVKTRRRFLQVTGGAGVLGFAGCVQSQNGGDTTTTTTSPDDGDDGTTTTTTQEPIDSVKVGVLNPISGPFAPLGAAQRQGARTAVEWVNQNDDFEFQIEAVYEDTQTDPAAGRQKAQKVIEQDNVDLVAGCINSSVALAVSSYCNNQQVVYTSGGAAMELTGAECNEYTFRNETNTAQQAAGLVNYAATELGSRWWIHTADYAYGNSAIDQIRNRINQEGHDVEIVGTTKPDIGTSNFGSYINQISNSDAEVLAIPLTGGPLINFIKQAASEGLTEEIEIIGTAIFAQVIRGALGADADGLYSSTLYNHKLETGDNQQFVSAYQNAFDGPPGSFARVGYEAVRMPIRAIQAAGTKDPTVYKDALAGTDMTTILGETHFRECDHQSANPVWTARMEMPSSGNVTEVNLLDNISGSEATPPCEAIQCSL